MKKGQFLLTIVFVFLFLSFSMTTPKRVSASILDTFAKIFSSDNTSMKENTEENLEAAVAAETDGSPSLESHVTKTIQGTQYTILLNVGGPPESVLQAMTEEEREVAYSIYGHGAIGAIGGHIASLYQPPASGVRYVADVFESAKLIPQAQAQGTGFAALNPILETWKTFRNVAYLFFVLIFLVIGFMIMFRHKINGQTVVTAQQAIPNIVVSLIFVTFSYAIAGFLIDLMYVLMYLFVGLFGGSEELINMNIIQLGLKMTTSGFSQSWSSVNAAIQQIITLGGVSEVISWASSLTVSVIVAIAILIGVFKLFFELLKSYINIVLNVAFSPLILMVGALPGKNVFGEWLKQIVGNLAAFPTVLLLMLMSQMITNYDLQTGGFMPPFMLGPGIGGALPAVLGIGILLVIPEIVKQVKEAIGAKGGVVTQLAQTAGERFKKATPSGLSVMGAGAGALTGTAGGVAGGSIIGGVREARAGGDLRAILTEAGKTGLKGGALGFGGGLVGGGMAPKMGPAVFRRVKTAVSGGFDNYTQSAIYDTANELRKRREAAKKARDEGSAPEDIDIPSD